MRIGIFSESYEPLLNGVAVSVITLARELRSLGHMVHIFAPACKGYHESSDVTRFPSIVTPFESNYPVPIPIIRGLSREIRQLELDVIHTQTPWILGWLGLLLGRRLGIPVVSTNHTQYTEYAHYFTLAPKALTRSFIAANMRSYYRRCDGLVVPSDFTAQLLRDCGVDAVTHTIPTGNSLDTSRDVQARDLIRGELGIGKSEKVLLYVGRLAREKNVELLIRSFDQISKRKQDVTLLIVGGGPFEDECKRIVQSLDSASRIKLTGGIPREKVAKYYSAGDIFTQPSTTETQGLVLGEALQAGLPCVAVRAGGSPEVLREGSDSLLSENTVEDFASKVDALVSDPEMMICFSANAVENSKRFSPEAMASSMLEVYHTAVSTHASSCRT
jgi:glycosyltransferase involved in cell wall biosynthesis